ncbi:hypothetical protein NY08_5039 [Rhodococcus sp. B7740]|nr:hypothetical protein NY08_5039 [Rhodococcus sp. B7740]
MWSPGNSVSFPAVDASAGIPMRSRSTVEPITNRRRVGNDVQEQSTFPQ